MSLNDRVRCSALHARTMSAADAAALIPAGANVGMSGFTGAGYPKALPQAIAARAKAEHAAGRPYKLNVWTGASTAAECDGVMAEAEALGQRLPFNTDPKPAKRSMRARSTSSTCTCRTWHSTHGLAFWAR